MTQTTNAQGSTFAELYAAAIEPKTTQHDERHGGAYDRGGADYYYHRPEDPHYFTGGTSTITCDTRITDLTPGERQAYLDGYADAEAFGAQKDWG
jgi:hypothetical protein